MVRSARATFRVRALLVPVLVLLCALVACAAPAPEAPTAASSPPVTSSSPPAASSPAPSGTATARDAQACEQHAGNAESLRQVAEQIESGPVLPVGVALFLLGPRDGASPAGVRDAELAVALTELVAAIDDLDAQGRSLLPPGGNPAQDAVQLDPARLRAAVETLDGLCARPT